MAAQSLACRGLTQGFGSNSRKTLRRSCALATLKPAFFDLKKMTQHNLLPAQDTLKKLFLYSFIEGALYWRKRPSPKAKLNQPAGSLDKEGYFSITINGKAYRRHRLIWAYFYGDPMHLEIDHINRTKGDDRLENLRLATRQQNSYNTLYSVNKSGVPGVCWHKRDKKWRASIKINGKNIHLGYFSCINDAKLAYAKASSAIHSDFSVFCSEAN